MTEENKAIKVFFSYSHKDQALFNQIEAYLSVLTRQRRISSWHYRKIEPGIEWEKEIDAHLKNAQIILLLVSVNFLASDYCCGIEMKQALAKQDAGEARVIPIILSACEWKKTALGKLQALPTGGKPISQWNKKDEALLDVVTGIRNVIEQDFNFSTSVSENKNGIPYGKTNQAYTSATNNIDPLTPSDIIVDYRHIKKTHSCEVSFTLAQRHSLKYNLQWHGVRGDKFTLSLDNVVMFDTGLQFLGIPDLKKDFHVENVKGTFFYHNKDNHFKVMITVGSKVVFEKDDSWNS